MASEGVSRQSWWSLLLSMTSRGGASQHQSSGTWFVFSNLYSTLRTFLKQNDKSLQMLLETYTETLGTKTLLPQSQWNFWRSLKSSINYGFLKPCQNCKVSPKEGSVSGNMELHWLIQFSSWECTWPCKRTGALSQEYNFLVILMQTVAL